MTLTLPKAQERLVNRLVRSGKFPNSQAVLREAIKRLARDPEGVLSPQPAASVPDYQPTAEELAEERAVGAWAAASLRRAAKQGREL